MYNIKSQVFIGKCVKTGRFEMVTESLVDIRGWRILRPSPRARSFMFQWVMFIEWKCFITYSYPISKPWVYNSTPKIIRLNAILWYFEHERPLWSQAIWLFIFKVGSKIHTQRSGSVGSKRKSNKKIYMAQRIQTFWYVKFFV